MTGSKYDDKLPNIANSLNNIVVHSNIFSNTIVSGVKTDILYQFSVDNSKINYPFYKEGRRLLYSKIETKAAQKAVEKGAERLGNKTGEIVANKLDGVFNKKKRASPENMGHQIIEI